MVFSNLVRVAPNPGASDPPANAALNEHREGDSGQAGACFTGMLGGAAAAVSHAAKETAGAAAAKAASAASQAVASNAAASKAVGAAAAASQVAMEVAGSAATKASTAAATVVAESRDRVEKRLEQLRGALEVWAKQKIQSYTERLLDRLPEILKRMLEDPDMPRFISRGKDRAVDGVWKDARAELMWEVAVLLDAKGKEEEEQALPPAADCFRAFFRYHMFPYDKSFWAKARDPWWILFQVIPLLPIYALNPMWFLFTFLIIDKTEEFQLVSFILKFKGYQYLSLGVLRACLGLVLFLSCVTAPADSSEHVCESSGPGSAADNAWMAVAGFLLQIVLVWIAFLLLRCSRSKGRSAVQGNVDVSGREVTARPGGYIIYLLWYDVMTFVPCLALVCYALASRPKPTVDDWVVEHVVFAAQVMYGFLSFPFFLFTLPVLQRMLTHSLPTAYDPQGRCRQLAEAPRPREPVRREELVSSSDLDGLLAKVKELLPAPMQGGKRESPEKDEV